LELPEEIGQTVGPIASAVPTARVSQKKKRPS
jgi:hypothetical protein